VFAAARIGLALCIPAADSGRRKSNIIKPPEKNGLLSSGPANSPGTEVEEKQKTPPE